MIVSPIAPGYADTHVDAVAAVIAFINGHFPGKAITVGEASATAFYRKKSTWDVYRLYGYDAGGLLAPGVLAGNRG